MKELINKIKERPLHFIERMLEEYKEDFEGCESEQEVLERIRYIRLEQKKQIELELAFVDLLLAQD